MDCRNGVINPETNGTLQAKSSGGSSVNLNNVVLNPEDIILRRLTPTECARLQGMPDWWTTDIHYTEVSEEDLVFWRDVFETYRLATNPKRKPFTDKQIIKWLQDPYSDSAEYKMWGNGMALPCVLYVMEGVVGALKERLGE